MSETFFHFRRIILSHALQQGLRLAAHFSSDTNPNPSTDKQQQHPENPTVPEDFRPLEAACFQNPYAFYRLLRQDYPVYQLPNGIWCISRYEDIQAISSNPDVFSSSHQAEVAFLRPGQDIEKAGRAAAFLGGLGVTPCDVLALADPPLHGPQRKVAGRGFAPALVRSIDKTVSALSERLLQPHLTTGYMDFMQDYGWRLPMLLVMQLLGYPESDFERIKNWCVHAIGLQSGIASDAQLMRHRSAMMPFMRYCWQRYSEAKKAVIRGNAPDNISTLFARNVLDADGVMNDRLAVAAIFQLLIAGSDSSATSVGNGIRMLIENPDVAEAVRTGPAGRLDAFVEEVFRLEAAFQGHFRWVRQDTSLHGTELPRGSRIFLMWASGNRDESVFPNPDAIDLNRSNGKKHLTFGWGPHACIGRQLARVEVRTVLSDFLTRTRNLQLAGDAPYLASMFSRTLVRLPIRFDARDAGDTSSPAIAATPGCNSKTAKV